MEALWYKNPENPRDRKSHTWALVRKNALCAVGKCAEAQFWRILSKPQMSSIVSYHG